MSHDLPKRETPISDAATKVYHLSGYARPMLLADPNVCQRLEIENEELRNSLVEQEAEASRWKACEQEANDQFAALDMDYKALRKDRDQLRDALFKIASNPGVGCHMSSPSFNCKAIAEEALRNH